MKCYCTIFLTLLFCYKLNAQEIFGRCDLDTTIMVSTIKWYDDPEAADLKCIRNFEVGKINVLLEQDSGNCLQSFIILNLTEDNISFESQDANIQAIREAKNIFGVWRPIEYWMPSWCGNSYYEVEIKPNEFLKASATNYKGNFKTKIRYKIKLRDRIIYSESYSGEINLGQFKRPKHLTKEHFFK